MGHGMFDLLDVPLFGRPEDAADQFAAFMMLKLGKDQTRRLIGGAAFTYKDYVEKTNVVVPQTAFVDVHGAPMQRFYNLLCMGYGAEMSQMRNGNGRSRLGATCSESILEVPPEKVHLGVETYVLMTGLAL
jgi:Putative metallopeptidase